MCEIEGVNVTDKKSNSKNENRRSEIEGMNRNSDREGVKEQE